MDIYAQNILDRYKKPFYKDKKIDANMKGNQANHSCGDTVNIEMQIEDDKIKAYSFSGNGCAISMAATDMMGDLIDGITSEKLLKLTKEDIYEILGIEISVRRSKCALLALMAIQNAILQSSDKEKLSWSAYHL